MIRLLIATRNRHKVEEICAMLGDSFDCVSLREYPEAPEVVEDAATFEGNARKKAEELATWLETQHATRNTFPDYVLADDSGLEVDALDGAPGVHSARFAALDSGVGGNAKDADNNAKLLRLLCDLPMQKRTARFRCVLALVPLNPQSAIRNPQCVDGVCEGRIGFEAHGGQGFGYDPLFLPDGFQQTFAELGEETKNRISHRSQALARLKTALA
jgi:XTP/dITP diphosphohydrolase